MKHILLILGVVFFACEAPKTSETQATAFIIESPTSENASLPYLTTGQDGNLYFSWIEQSDSGWVDFKYSYLHENKWSEPELIASGHDWFINWADYPMIAVDKDGNMIAHFLRKNSAGSYSYDVNVTLKPHSGTWSEPIAIHNDGTPTEHGFVTLLPKNDSSFQVGWLDGRKTAGGHGGHNEHAAGAMTLRTAVMDLEGNVSERAELDNRVCDCCQTTGVLTKSGISFIYRNRSELEIRDLSIVRKTNNKWTAPKTFSGDNWHIAGCPVNGPRAVVMDDNLAIAWFTAPKGKAQVKTIFSTDGGQSFNPPITIDNSNPLGRVDQVMLDKDRAVVSWVDIQNDTTFIKYREVNSSGSMGSEEILTKTSSSRGSGFPQMEINKGALYFAWTDFGDDSPTIKLQKVLSD